MVWDRPCLEDSEQMDDLLNELTNYKDVYRRAPATLGLLEITCSMSQYVVKKILRPFVHLDF